MSKLTKEQAIELLKQPRRTDTQVYDIIEYLNESKETPTPTPEPSQSTVTYNTVKELWQDTTIYPKGTILYTIYDNLIFIADGINKNIDLVDVNCSLMFLYYNEKRVSRILVRSYSDNSFEITTIEYCDNTSDANISIEGTTFQLTYDPYRFRIDVPVVFRCTTIDGESTDHPFNTLNFSQKSNDWSEHYVGTEFDESITIKSVQLTDLTVNISNGEISFIQNPTGVDTQFDIDLVPQQLG